MAWNCSDMRANKLKRVYATFCLLGAMTLLASCAHTELKAACSDQDVPSRTTAFVEEPAKNIFHGFGLAKPDDCGPLQPVN